MKRFIMIGLFALTAITIGKSQTAIPEILKNGTLPDQMSYIENRTNIYQDYRAIREDMFQLIKNNSVDSLSKAKNKIIEVSAVNKSLNTRIDSLNSTVSSLTKDLREITRTKNAISLLGISVNKNVYNSIMWIIIAALVFLLTAGYLVFRRNYIVTRNVKKELNDLKKEYDEYRNKARLDREKMSMDHFKEMQKLKGR